MQELLRCEKLLNFEPTMEGAKQFLKEFENDDKIQSILKQTKLDQKGTGEDKHEQMIVAYAINLKKNTQNEVGFIENLKDRRNQNLLKNIMDPELGFGPLASARSRDANPFLVENSVADGRRVKMNLLDTFNFMLQPDAVNPSLADVDLLPSNLEMERDISLVQFMNTFYKKYSHIYYSEQEKEKAAKLRIRVKLGDGVQIYLTRNELDENLTRYRHIYASFCTLKKHINKTETIAFEQDFNISTYFQTRLDCDERMSFESAPFKVVWMDMNTGSKLRTDDNGTSYVRGNIFNSTTISIFKDIHDKELGDDIIVSFLCRKHCFFIEFMIRHFFTRLKEAARKKTLEKLRKQEEKNARGGHKS